MVSSMNCDCWASDLWTLSESSAPLSSCWVICVWGTSIRMVIVRCLPAVGYALLTSCRSALSRSGCSFRSWVLGSLPWLFFLLSPSMPALSCAKHRRRCPRGHRSRGEALFPRASRPLILYTFWPWTAVEVSWLARPFFSRLMFVARLQLRTLDFYSRHCISDLVPRGRRALLDQFRTFWLTGPRNQWSLLCLCSWQTPAPLRAGTRLATSSCRTPASTLVVRPLWIRVL